MKNMKKILALLVAVLMMLSVMVPAIADDYTGDTSVKVTGLAEGDVAHFYQVLEWVGGAAQDNVAGWKAKAPFDTILTKAKLTEVLVGTAATETEEKKPATGITAELANDLAKAASGEGTVINAAKVDEAYIATLPTTEAGMWMGLITPADANTIYNPVFVSADFDKTNTAGDAAVVDTATYSDSAAPKKSTVDLTKTAENTADYTGDHAGTTAVNDIVTYTVNTTIPGYGKVYDNPHFKLTDTLTNLTLQKKEGSSDYDITVTGIDAANYDLVATDTGYTLTVKEAYLKATIPATSITIVYKAKVDESAATTSKAINEEDNEVQIEYSHTPTDETDYDVKKDTTQHYTFTLDASGMGWGQNVSGKKTSELVKVGRDAAGNPITERTETSQVTNTETWTSPLAGAQFGLWKNAECTGDAYLTATTEADGRMTFAGLDAGNYWLKEIQAPTGFVTNDTIVPVVISATLKSVKVTETILGKTVTYDTDILESYTVSVNGETNASYQFKNQDTASSNDIKWDVAECVEKPHQFENIQGIELPHTGGMGTTLLYVGGSILVLLAVILLVTKRRMNAED